MTYVLIISVRIACNIIAASSDPRSAGCHVTLAGGGDTVLDESLFYNGFLKAKDDSEGRTIFQVLGLTIVQVLKGTVQGGVKLSKNTLQMSNSKFLQHALKMSRIQFYAHARNKFLTFDRI